MKQGLKVVFGAYFLTRTNGAKFRDVINGISVTKPYFAKSITHL